MTRYLFITSCLIVLLIQSACSLETRVARANKKYMKRAPFDAVIIPGYPYREEKNRILFTVRVNFAKYLYDKGIAKNIIFSGAAVRTPYVEGKIMKMIADSLGIPPEHTFVEDKALHSNQNALYGTRMAKKMGYKNIALATDPYQFSYLTLLRTLYTPKTAIITFNPNEMPVYDVELPSIDSSSAYVQDFTPLN